MGLFKTTDKGTTDPSELLLEKYGIKLKEDEKTEQTKSKKSETKKK
jgi:hypothetical protein